MGRTHVMGIELPVGRLIDRLPDMTDIDLENDDWWAEDSMNDIANKQNNIREFLELIEPHSRRGVKQVTHDGKAIWGDDWSGRTPL